MKRRTIVIVGLLLVLGSIPATSAEHLSAGAEDTIAQDSHERPDPDGSGPQEARRSVSGTTQAVRDHPYGVGTMPADQCYTDDGEVQADDVDRLQEAHGFCNMLVYHEDSTPDELKTTSLPDQTLFDPIGHFDVIRTHDYSTGASACVPFCPDGDGLASGLGGPGQPAGGQEAFDAFHNAGSALGLTDTPEDANREAPSDRAQTYGVSLHAASPRDVIQDNVGLWEMNGWWWPTAQSTFAAYVEDTGGDPISQSELDGIVSRQKQAGDLNTKAEAAICGWTPDFNFLSVGPGATGLNCEFSFEYHGPSEPSDSTFDEGYQDECQAEAYVCNSVNGPAWYTACNCLGLVDPKVPGTDPFGGVSVFAGPEGQTDYIRWHFVVAPHASKCGGAQEPGFSFDGDGANKPFLAHDLDVFTSITDVNAGGLGGKTAEVMDYSDENAETYTSQVDEAIGEPTSLIPGDLPVPAETSNVVKDDALEPNNADPIGSIDDTSRTAENGALDASPLERDLGGLCEALFAQETRDTVDPWVDYLDNEVNAVQDVDQDLTYASDERVERRIDLYQTSDDNQDDSNRPGPSLYTTTGKVGFFTDTDDDGEFDQMEAGLKYNPQNIQQLGAYPMTWDMRLDSKDTISENKGCQLGTGGSTTMPQEMAKLGYGPNTGLAQAIYLKEPTAFVDPDTTGTAVYPGGNNVYLLMSQAARVQYDVNTDGDGDANDNPLDNEIDELVKELRAYADGQNGDLDAPDIFLPAEELGLDAAFKGQCTERTGGFQSAVQFAHHCSDQFSCEGDTIATMYTFEVTGDGTLDGSPVLPTFSPGSGPYNFGAFQHTWYDVDPFDNNPDRNDDEENPPPSPDSGVAGEGVS